jgi:RNA polymerase sigma-70 factor (ECF subfamily)
VQGFAGALSRKTSLSWWNGSGGLDATTRTLLDLLDLYGHRLHALVFKLTANRDAADELLQDLFVRMRKAPEVAAAPISESYLFRAAINLAFDWRKRNRRIPKFTLLTNDVAADSIAPLERMVRYESVERVLAAMEQLSEQDRELITLRFLQGESSEWISDHWGSTPHRIRSRCSKAVARLRKLVGQDGTVKSERQT